MISMAEKKICALRPSVSLIISLRSIRLSFILGGGICELSRPVIGTYASSDERARHGDIASTSIP